MRGQGIGEFRSAGKGRTAGRSFHQRRAPKPVVFLVDEAREQSVADLLAAIDRITRHRSRIVAVYLSPAGAFFVLPDDLSVSHQAWAAKHEAWLIGWYSGRVTAEDILAAIP